MSKGRALGFIETVGLAAAIAAADAALKAANVELIGRENSRGQGCITIKLTGEIGAVKAALDAAKTVAAGVSEIWSTDMIPRPADGLDLIMVHNGDTLLNSCKQAEAVDFAPPEEIEKIAPAVDEPRGETQTDPPLQQPETKNEALPDNDVLSEEKEQASVHEQPVPDETRDDATQEERKKEPAPAPKPPKGGKKHK
ncbi:MAG: BMC domain-containing protein [Synergistaceae bacterium]|jgi:microcompartment protein CcmL/EutN|nr:BMC domain-containing protein [Synergistaceae bacterium]